MHFLIHIREQRYCLHNTRKKGEGQIIQSVNQTRMPYQPYQREYNLGVSIFSVIDDKKLSHRAFRELD